MKRTESLTAPVEIRQADDGPRLAGVIMQEGRAATGGRAELFAPGAVLWPPEGIAIRTEHLGAEHGRAVPTRDADGSIRIDAPAPPAVVAAIGAGKRFLSVEFLAARELGTAAGVREIQRALVDGAALVRRPEYSQARAELRGRRPYAV